MFPGLYAESHCRSKWLAGLAGIWVRLVDPLVGEAVGMRVDVELADGTTAAGVYYCKLLSQSVGCAPARGACFQPCHAAGVCWCYVRMSAVVRQCVCGICLLAQSLQPEEYYVCR